MEVKYLPYYDLRTINSVSEAQAITKISDVAVVIYPKDNNDSELMTALRKIELSNVAVTLNLCKEEKFYIRNGVTELNESDFKGENDVFIINGVCVLKNVPVTIKARLIVNGFIILPVHFERYSGISIEYLNGRRIFADVERIINYDNKITITSDFLDYVKPNTMVIAQNKIEIDDDVTEDELRSSGIKLLAINKIYCDNEDIAPFVMENAYAGNGVEF